jgi:poly-gamma-glutamate capsule biosynthesis protein CapA/YwtB (metallophosphatase superfamily)
MRDSEASGAISDSLADRFSDTRRAFANLRLKNAFSACGDRFSDTRRAFADLRLKNAFSACDDRFSDTRRAFADLRLKNAFSTCDDQSETGATCRSERVRDAGVARWAFRE